MDPLAGPGRASRRFRSGGFPGFARTVKRRFGPALRRALSIALSGLSRIFPYIVFTIGDQPRQPRPIASFPPLAGESGLWNGDFFRNVLWAGSKYPMDQK